ncbi:MAG TPA: phosphoribosylformylglycinamidine cyclo-ligase [Caldisericia bacterium]|nr:phosphoribosylformylglycinamidine cyclo-ligase [Caldisericia bacterium]HPF49085.1 phosphoribosylformylglycinamidine cyclo-ligase [Caldisericia bacterium]HPI83051.1 phosphoribosylformylglycinamidine cyclo-ligase [Caldisericia bacterium]HPQ92278.1 phosphoribosylformylglycinamidine cyclo-ligase [Caldisericia bacterium]HRV74624.1 phosphoribosylformylglycinamidine cyclo-ligase [Caldisericia bacterium]
MADAYSKAGVSQSKANTFVDKIKGLASSTNIPGVLGELGFFGGLFELPKGYENPVLVSGADGVGSKVLLAIEMGKHDTIGIDCVAMNVDDIVCAGAKPLFFLDYLGISRLDDKISVDIVKGLAEGCKQSNCALIGGETAQLVDIYRDGEYDLAGFVVGIVEKLKIIDGSRITDGDVIVGLPSSGLHSNGYTLARKAILSSRSLGDNLPDIPHLGLALLEPTRIYAPYILKMIEAADIKGIAHITGGGLTENIPRVMKSGTAVVKKSELPRVPIIDLAVSDAGLSEEEAFTTFNMGIGMIVVVPSSDASKVCSLYQGSRVIGKIVGDGKPTFALE